MQEMVMIRKYRVQNILDVATPLIEVDGVKYYEHPHWGDEVPVIAIYKDVAFLTSFFDPFNSTDTEYVKEEYEDALELKTYHIIQG